MASCVRMVFLVQYLSRASLRIEPEIEAICGCAVPRRCPRIEFGSGATLRQMEANAF
jgi:hypothetical protein